MNNIILFVIQIIKLITTSVTNDEVSIIRIESYINKTWIYLKYLLGRTTFLVKRACKIRERTCVLDFIRAIWHDGTLLVKMTAVPHIIGSIRTKFHSFIQALWNTRSCGIVCLEILKRSLLCAPYNLDHENTKGKYKIENIH